ncbi:MAG: hypothetical protein V1648_04980 [Candidatus Aenigmatarchaeota archaeon]
MYEAAGRGTPDDISLKKGFMQLLKGKIGGIEDMGNGRSYPAPISQVEHFKVIYKSPVPGDEVKDCVKETLAMSGGWSLNSDNTEEMTFSNPSGNKRTVRLEHYGDETFVSVFDMR